jgi:hypothetical protein
MNNKNLLEVKTTSYVEDEVFTLTYTGSELNEAIVKVDPLYKTIYEGDENNSSLLTTTSVLQEKTKDLNVSAIAESLGTLSNEDGKINGRIAGVEGTVNSLYGIVGKEQDGTLPTDSLRYRVNSLSSTVGQHTTTITNLQNNKAEIEYVDDLMEDLADRLDTNYINSAGDSVKIESKIQDMNAITEGILNDINDSTDSEGNTKLGLKSRVKALEDNVSV